jgi:hypothetical protein
MRSGVCRIGNWMTVGEFAPLRSLHGRIDEVVIWKRALSEEDIAAELERGRPSLLWPRRIGPTSWGESGSRIMGVRNQRSKRGVRR